MQLEVRNISHAYNGRRILDRLSLELKQGRIGCLVGPSGSGKSTVLRCIAGFEPILGGEILTAGRRISGDGVHVPPERRRIGMVFQDYALLPHLTVTENVMFGLHKQPANARLQRAREVIETVGLDAERDQLPHELSGGQQQRVALARALAPKPELLLLDEPFSNLDIELRERLGLEIRDILRDAGATALMVTHDQYEAFAIADEIGVLDQGRVVQWDTAYNLYHKPDNRFVANFIGQGVFLPGILRADNSVEIELGVLHGTLAGPIREGGESGRRVMVLLRPDDIVHDDDSPLTAKVRNKAFRGAEILYTLELHSGAEVLSLVPSHHNHRLGEPIGIRLEADHVVAFEADLPPGVSGDAAG